MFCHYCGKENAVQSKFCKYCGKELIPPQEPQGEATVRVLPQQPYAQQHIPYVPPMQAMPEQTPMGSRPEMPPAYPPIQQPPKKKLWPTVLLISLALLLLAIIIAVVIGMMGDSDKEEGKPTTQSTTASTTVATEPTQESQTQVPTTEEVPQTSEPEPTETTEPEPAETEEPTTQTAPATQGTPVNLTPDLQYSVNIFLSNFSEQGFGADGVWDEASQTYVAKDSYFESKTADPMQMIKMAWLNAKINGYEYEHISYDNTSYYGVSFETINYLTEWFFGRSFSAKDVVPEDWYGRQNWIVVDDMVCHLAADGETYNKFSVADEMTDLGNGLYRVNFTVYYAEIGSPLAYVGGPIQDKSVYYLSASEAAAHTYLDAGRKGFAIIKPYVTPNGTSTFTIVSYELFAD